MDVCTHLTEFPTNRGRTVWLNPLNVSSVQAIPTRYGARLLLGVGDAEPSIWIEDRPESREALGLNSCEQIKAKPKISEMAAATEPPRRRGRPRKKFT